MHNDSPPRRLVPAADGIEEYGLQPLSGRRAEIVAALRQCMLQKGYAETSLTDLAKSAGMSVSHFLYYYPGKDAVLVELCEQFVKRAYEDIAEHKARPPRERIEALADNLFVRGAIARSEFSILRELNALATHRPEVRDWLRRFDAWIVRYLSDLFSKAPRQAGLSAADAAEIAAAVWMGLVNNSDFDAKLNDKRAARLFRQTLLSFAGLDRPVESSRPKRLAAKARRPSKAV